MDAHHVGQDLVERLQGLLIGKPDGGLPVSAHVALADAIQEVKGGLGGVGEGVGVVLESDGDSAFGSQSCKYE